MTPSRTPCCTIASAAYRTTKGSGCPLVDHLCTPGSEDIGSGKHEIRLICDAICCDEKVLTALSTPSPTGEQLPQEVIDCVRAWGLPDGYLKAYMSGAARPTGDAGEPVAPLKPMPGTMGWDWLMWFASEMHRTPTASLAELLSRLGYVAATPPTGADALDARRLDWMAQHGVAIERDIEGEWRTIKYRRYGEPIRGPERMTLRAAIDAAIASTEGEKP